jgi:hypothetical protein
VLKQFEGEDMLTNVQILLGCKSPAFFISSDIEKFQKQTLIQIIFSTDAILGSKVVHLKFFEELYFV